MKIQAVISQDLEARFWYRPELVYSIDITPYLKLIATLLKIAKFAKERPSRDMAAMMAYLIGQMEAGLRPQIEEIGIALPED